MHVQVLRQALLDAVEQRQLSGALIGLTEQPLRFREQPRILQRDSHAAGNGADHAFVAFGERMWRIIPDDHHADDRRSGHDRHAKPRFSLDGDITLGVCAHEATGSFLLGPGAESEGAPLADDLRRQSLTEGNRLPMDTPGVIDLVREADEVGAHVVETDVQVGGVEHAREPLADQLDDRVEFELPSQRVADLVDDGELIVALLGLGQQPFRFGEQPRVLERNAHAGGERRQQALVALAERLAFDSLERNRAHDPLAGKDRHPEPGFFVRG